MIKQLNLEQIQNYEFEMLKRFDEFCNEHNLRFVLLYGTLIGAVRHKGFIPWDDDVDLGMPRPDYEKLISMKKDLFASTGYKLTGLRDLPLEVAPIVKIENPHIRVEERGATKEEHLWLDVFPIDCLPADEQKAKGLCKKILGKKMLFTALTSPASSALTLKRRLVKIALKPLGLLTSPSKLAAQITGLAKSTPYGSTDVANAITWTIYGFEGRFSLHSLEEFVYVEFEGWKFPAMGEWDRNLSGIYGNYMLIPDEANRATHSMKAWIDEIA